MQSFEFVMILISIITGLAIATLLTMLSRVLRREARGGLLHTLWVVGVLLVLVQDFWARWEHQSRADWSIVDLIIFLLVPLLLFVAASLLAPSDPGSASLDEYFMANRKPFFAVMSASMASASLELWTLLGGGSGASDMARGAVVAMFITLALVSNRRLQLLGVVIWIAALAGFAMRWTFSLSRMGGGV